ncbi:MAG: DEAD/DEAH box helicase [Gammaproteobacteria bacterium]|nr:DEAD/DEAH box helicase [Gammaproteobacteria bacterium]
MTLPTDFHPATRAWFSTRFGTPTPAQGQAWPVLRDKDAALIAAPTGSGKTLAAFLAAIDELVREAVAGRLRDETRVLYVSPLKALSNDVHANLDEPLEGIDAALRALDLPGHGIRAAVRTGDTPPAEREAQKRLPPHILVTTPESLYILLTSDKGRRMLKTVATVIVDEIHALAPNKRGAHLALSLARLELVTGRPVHRIGLSATQKPVELVARFLMGDAATPCRIVDSGHKRERDLALELPRSPLGALMAAEVWGEIYDRIAEWSDEHRTLLVFANQRRLVERIARFVGERIGAEAVAAHHGSLAREQRLDAEQRLKAGRLKVMVATASLELGIDIGDVELVVQLGSPRSIATFLQRVGRANHSVGGVPKARLIPLSRDDLVECTALLDAVRAGELDSLRIPEAPVDVLAQQLIAEVACGERGEAELLAMARSAWPYRELSDEGFQAVLAMLAEALTTPRGRRKALIHRDEVHAIVKPREGTRLAAVTNGGAIPDLFDYQVILEPEGLNIGTLNEDFAFESVAGDIFQLGNHSYRILKVEQGKVRVADAAGQPPTLPFWLGEAPGRADELSAAVSALRGALSERLKTEAREAVYAWAAERYALDLPAAVQLVDYLAEAEAALGALPTQDCLVLERFFDEVGDQHLVLHSPYGSRVNRAWGLALRKRFCRQFNFELQAAALNDAIILSLGSTHSFALDEVARYLHPDTARAILIQALFDAPLFGTRWRWNATTALAVLRFRGGKRVPAQWQRSEAEDLVALVFPDQLACLENIQGEREVPDHPLVRQTITDCLTEAMDIAGLEAVLKRLWAGEIRVLARDLSAPSVLSHEIVGARPYAFLDDGEAEERRTLNINTTRFAAPEDAQRLSRLDPDAIAKVRAEAWPEFFDAESLHEALVLLGLMTETELAGHQAALAELAAAHRAASFSLADGMTVHAAAERWAAVEALHPRAAGLLAAVGSASRRAWSAEEAAIELMRSRLECLGPVTAEVLFRDMGLSERAGLAALFALEQEGFALRGTFTGADEEWCERGLLARMHRYTLKRMRDQIRPVSAARFLRFLQDWHHLGEARVEGEGGMLAALDLLEGWQAAAGAWEHELLAGRVLGFLPVDLDRLCTSGAVAWLRLNAPGQAKAGALATTPIAVLGRDRLPPWRRAAGLPDADALELGHSARRVHETLKAHGASFFDDLVADSGLLRTQVEEGLSELAATGLAHADSYTGLRALVTPQAKRPRFGGAGRAPIMGIAAAGRWSLLRRLPEVEESTRFSLPLDALEAIARALLRRYGVVFRALLAREDNLPPWRDLLYVLRRLEARGEVRGGRFVAGFAGEQYALAEAWGLLKKEPAEGRGQLLSISAVDPLNLVGILVPGTKVPALPGNRILFRDGAVVAVLIAGETQYLSPADSAEQWAWTAALRRRA